MKFKHLTFDTLGGVKGVGQNFDIAMLIYRHCAIMVYSKNLLNIRTLRKYKGHYTQKLI